MPLATLQPDVELEPASDDDADVAAVVTLTPLLLTAAQLGLLLGGVSDRKIRAMASAGEIPKAVKLGRLTRWRRTDNERWVAGLS